jgi:hypothetical protein
LKVDVTACCNKRSVNDTWFIVACACICVEGVYGHAGEALTSSSLLVQYKKERTAFWQLIFIGDIGVEGGMVSQCTACTLANLRAPVSQFFAFCSYSCMVLVRALLGLSFFVLIYVWSLFTILKQEYGMHA